MKREAGRTRRGFLQSLAALLTAALSLRTLAAQNQSRTFEIEAMRHKYRSAAATDQVRHYRVHATVSLFGVPLITKEDAGGALLRFEECASDGARTTALQFCGGSWPGKLRGFNRFGMTQEMVRAEQSRIVESAYLSFMTSSPEKDLAHARRSFKAASGGLLVSASYGCSKQSSNSTAMDRIVIQGGYTWLDCPRVSDALRNAPLLSSEQTRGTNGGALPTFLYAVRSAMMAGGPFETEYLHAGKAYCLSTRCAQKDGGDVLINGSIRTSNRREISQFRVIFDRADPAILPITVEFRPRSFLALRFEHIATQPAPAIRSLLQEEPA